MTPPDKRLIDNAARVLATAFNKDPLFSFFFPDDTGRTEHAYYTFRFIASHAYKNGYVYSSPSASEGISIWLPSSKIERGLADQLRFGVLRMLLKHDMRAIKRQIAASSHMKALHSSLLREEHLYLSSIGIVPEHRGRGLAADLLSPGLKKAESENIPVYLDTHNENNIGLYERYGFCVAAETVIPGSEVRHWAMIRWS